MKCRINNIEFRKYKGSKDLYEIIKWFDNPKYGKYNDYLNDGYIESFGGDFLEKDHIHISKSLFELPEICYVVSFIKFNKKEPCYYLESVGDRLLDLSEGEINDFWDVYNKSNKWLSKKLENII